MINENILKSEERAILALRSLYKSYGYRPFKMSKFEEYDLYAKNKDFLVSDRVITFNDTNGRLLALKPDVTMSIIKNTKDEQGCKEKVYYNENVYRVSGSTGQFKEIMQTGLECIGDVDVLDVFEAVLLAAKSLAAVSANYIIDISHMGLLSALIAEASEDVSFAKEVSLLIAEKNLHEAAFLCKKYEIDNKSTEKILSLFSIYGSMENVIEKLSYICNTDAQLSALSELSELSALLVNEGLSDKIRIDFSVVNDMNYYNGIVFKGFLAGICEGVLSGGEYGGLLRNMGRKSGAVGFALYLDMLEELDKACSDYDVDVLLLYSDKTAAANLIKRKNELISLGKSVSMQKAIPQNLRYRELEEI